MLINQLNKLNLDTPDILDEVMQTGSIASIKRIPQEIRSLFKIAHEIAPTRHLEHQLAFHEFTDNAVSKTINLPFTATPADVDAIYRRAWRGAAKGITIYRDRSKREQVIYQGIEKGSMQHCNSCTV
jgi:ribonucleoside-diphosphate reductase alpha chain